ncbi:MAG: hypothetical protein ACFCUU_11415 [Cyclobacteriaceae bacterium]
MKKIKNAINGVAKGYVRFCTGIYTGVSNTGKAVVRTFKPRYAVSFTMYNVIPGVPVEGNTTLHQFGKGEINEARNLFEKIVHKTSEIRLAPVEVHLIKGKKQILQAKQFGPVNELKHLKMTA